MTLPAIAVATFLALMMLYFILPNVKIRKLRYTMPGTIFSTFVLVFLTNWIAKYVSFALQRLDDLKLIGSLVVFALMIWFIFIARVLIIGAILNAVYQKQKLVRLKHVAVKSLNSSRKLENKKNTDRKSVSVFCSPIQCSL